ncbi:MAG: enoyl-CoA hydratase/isomerase family protein [Acidimicrobiia bacterium]
MPVHVTNPEPGLGLVVLDRPEVRNAFDLDHLLQLEAAFTSLVDQRARAVVVTGEGGAFCAGADLDTVRAAVSPGGDRSIMQAQIDVVTRILLLLQEAPFPLVAALEGPAVGAGMGLAMAADVRIASESMVFLTGHLRIAVSPDGGLSYYLARAVGAARARSLFVRNTPIDAAEARRLDLVDEVVPRGEALGRALEVAREVAGTAPLALVKMRELIDGASASTFADHLAAEMAGVQSLWPTADFLEGASAVLDKRAPRFEGR